MARRRFGFLPVFFTLLAVVFAIAVVVRIRSYDSAVPPGRSNAAASSTTGAERGMREPLEPAIPAEQPPGQSEQTMTLLEVPNATSAPVSRTDAPVDAVPVPAPQPSLLTRLLQPFTGGQPSSVSQPVTRPVSRSGEAVNAQDAQRQTRQTGEVSSAGSSDRTGGGEQAKETDVTSDSAPPRLMSIEFTPTQIRDGEETMLLIQAVDDLSGIRSVSGTIVAPSGAVQGFACQREGETNRFISRVAVPKDAAEGVWAVNYLNLMDSASNGIALTAVQGALPPTASFRVVSSRPDSQGPTLKALWIDKRAMRGGEKNTVFVQAEDDKSGLNLVSGIFQSPSRAARVGFVCRVSADTSWQCDFNAPACADCGQWVLEQIQLQDKANNMTTLRAQANELVSSIRVDISSDLCDATPPSVDSVTVDQPVVSNVEQSAVGVTATLSDDQCGVLSVSGQAVGPNTSGQAPRLYFSFTQTSGQHTWTGKVIIPRLAAKGVWRISFLQVLDRGQNLKTYTQNDPVLAAAAFTVQ